ncbi:uncharacterized protein [Drosophila pseudoobscura]|uniref:Uncharacterized protein n=1 Tax=Drosophila pseudoobscura pseudoobscura TaxID=46245 RepID=A0A6I8UZT2_DROPS|nr:uncharacterized protein LOC6901657 [Drosophila pseudoobscura]XP_015041938.2 uncharacterized protein LOC6901657 [Drosophila pseudoobscura]
MASNQQLKDFIVAEFIASLEPNSEGRVPSRDFEACMNVLMGRRRYVNRFTLPPRRTRDTERTNNPAGQQAPPILMAPGQRNQGGGDRVVFNMENLVPEVPQHQLIARIGGGDAELPPLGGVHYFRGNNEVAGDLILRHRAAMNLNFVFRGIRGGAVRAMAGRGQLRGIRRYQAGDGSNGGGAAAAAAGAGDGPGVGPNVIHLGAGDGPRGMFPNFEQAQLRLRAHAGDGDGPHIQQVQVVHLGDFPGDGEGPFRGQVRRRPRHRHIFNFVGQFLRDIHRRRFFLENVRAQIIPVAVGFRPQHHVNVDAHDGGEAEVAQADAQDGQRHEQEPVEVPEGGQPFADADIEEGLIANHGGGQDSQHDHGNEDAPGNGHGLDRRFRQAAEDLWEPLEMNGENHEDNDDNAQDLQQGNGDNNEIGQMMDIQQPIQAVAGQFLALQQNVEFPLDRIRDVLVQIQERLANIVLQVDNYEKILHQGQHQDEDGEGDADGDGDAA